VGRPIAISCGFEVLDALAQLSSEGFQGIGWDIAKGATEKFLAQSVTFSDQFGKLVADGGSDFLSRALLIVKGAGFNFGLVLPTPPDQGWLGDAELAANAGQAEALDAEPKEFVTGS
jgi:hypothetical protein